MASNKWRDPERFKGGSAINGMVLGICPVCGQAVVTRENSVIQRRLETNFLMQIHSHCLGE